MKSGKTSRIVQSFDTNWAFTRGDPSGSAQIDHDDSAWRRVDLPHDWSIEDLPPHPATVSQTLAVTEGVWRFQAGDEPGWKEPALDDTAWQEVMLPATWEAHSNYTQDNVYGWYRRKFQVPHELRGKDIMLALGKVDDVDETFVNGIKVGGMGTFPPQFATAWDQPRMYLVSADILKGDGTDVVAVRVFDGPDKGGIYEAPTPSIRSGPFDSYAIGGRDTGFTVGGTGWYRKLFVLPKQWQRRRVQLTFDGIYMNCQVWCNGKLITGHPYGYTGFHVDLSPHVNFGKAGNVLAIRVDASNRTSRWFPGAGIYRHVWLTATDQIHVAPWGTAVSTPHVTPQEAIVNVRTTVKNSGNRRRKVTVVSRIVNARGRTVGSASLEQSMAPASELDFIQDLTVPAPKLWSPDSPTLYRVNSSICVSGKTVDAVTTTFGIRTIQMDAEKGLRVNGVPIKLRGGCVHHDNGCLGACAYDRAEERRVALLKAAGFNAIRTAHNPPSPAFLDACDRLGMFVMDEAFDTWLWVKNAYDYGRYFNDWWQRDIESMVLRDRNHPSILFWSIGNEIQGQDKPECLTLSRTLSDYVRRIDSTRPVTQAFMPCVEDWNVLFPAFDALDLCGYNYRVGNYLPDHEKRPKQVIVGSESFPGACFDSWMPVVDLPYVIGDFVWTSYDYLGEAAIGRTRWDGEEAQTGGTWPWTVAFCGDLDICGWRRPQSYYREAVWGFRPTVSCFVRRPGPTDGVAPWGWIDEQQSWTWPGHDGKPLLVQAYSSCPRVKLTLNGRDLGVKETTRNTKFKAEWEVPYEPGELVAIGLDAEGAEAARWNLSTADRPAAIRLTPDIPKIQGDGQDLCFVTAEIVDQRGVTNPGAVNQVRFRVDGPGTIIAVSNGNPCSLESFQQPQRRAFRGRCQVVIKAGRKPGRIKLVADADGIKSGTANIAVKKPS